MFSDFQIDDFFTGDVERLAYRETIFVLADLGDDLLNRFFIFVRVQMGFDLLNRQVEVIEGC